MVYVVIYDFGNIQKEKLESKLSLQLKNKLLIAFIKKGLQM